MTQAISEVIKRTVWLVAAAWVAASCTFHAGDIEDSVFLPIPDGLVLENSDPGSCGNGAQYECGRVFVLTSAEGSRDDAVEASLVHLAEVGPLG